MIISIVFIVLIACGGAALTYLVATDKPLMWRLSAGTVIGSAIFGLVAFILASFVGFNTASLVVALAITLLPLVLLRRPDIRKKARTDWARAKGKFEGASLRKFAPFLYYAFFFIVFWLFFGRAMFEAEGTIHTGGSQNLGDLPYHLGAIFSFTEGNNFPPINPSWAGAKFSYPFISDFISACFVKVGADVASAMFVANVAWAFSLLVILERFAFHLTNNKLVGRIVPFLLFFSGGIGFLWFLNDVSASGKGLWEVLWKLPQDYTIGKDFRWGNAMVVLFMTQRGLLLGMPITLLVLGYLWKVFGTGDLDEAKIEDDRRPSKSQRERKGRLPDYVPALLPAFLVGLLAGSLVLIHLHSLAVLFIVTVFLFAIRPASWRQWLSFGIGTAVIAIPELIWAMTGSATESKTFFGWQFGWDKGTDNFTWFWLRNTGLAIPLLAAGIWLHWNDRDQDPDLPLQDRTVWSRHLLLFYLPFAFIFILGNVMTFAPWVWDNIKILIYWWVASMVFVAIALAWAWRMGKGYRVAAGIAFVVLIAAGALDVFRSASGQIKYGVFQPDAIKVAEQIKQTTDQKAVFLNAPTFNSPVVLTGRQSLMRYHGHLMSHGIDSGPREADVRLIYQGGPNADALLEKYNIDYVMMTPEERDQLKANEGFFTKFPIAAESGQFKVYKVK